MRQAKGFVDTTQETMQHCDESMRGTVFCRADAVFEDETVTEQHAGRAELWAG